jgi:DNA-binding GntR family transcriptional regulator
VQGGRGRSFRIAPTTREDIQDIYWVHATLAGELAVRACERISPEELDQLAHTHERWLAAVTAGNVSGLERENFEFHKVINKAAQSPKLLMLLRNTLRLIPEHFYSLLHDWAGTSTKDHEQIMAALRKRDAKAVRTASSRHVEQAGRMLIEYFDEQGFWTVPNG